MKPPSSAAAAGKHSRSTVLKAGLISGDTVFAMEAHSAIAAKIVERAGFEAIWASGFSVSSALGMRDRNEVSWSQLVEVLQSMNDVVSIPILVDADSGFGDFNNFRLLVRRLSRMGIAGACVEDKTFPKLNSFVDGRQSLADVDEFCGKIKAAKDIQEDDDFCVVARTEALIVGAGMDEAFTRACRYHQAGADAILIHSKQSTADEILEFAARWANRAPLVIVPTKYGRTPTSVFEQAGISVVIWANHLFRASVAAMMHVCSEISRTRTVMGVENHLVSMESIFELLNYSELTAAEDLYLGKPAFEAPSLAGRAG